ncbi:MAG: hypothetical protein RMK89_07095 [Armatimonadota bacterium]|nr:hypothetical protein [Armatimonadota bacterium]MDW8143211.1 hypothetical protein [Armatimonadota bacterium]
MNENSEISPTKVGAQKFRHQLRAKAHSMDLRKHALYPCHWL